MSLRFATPPLSSKAILLHNLPLFFEQKLDDWSNKNHDMMKTTTIQPSPLLNARATSTRLHQLKKSIHRTIARRVHASVPDVLLRRALDQAAETAESTGFPLLVFPLLAEETVARVENAVAQEEYSLSASEPASLAFCA
jgi:hypothetical protein